MARNVAHCESPTKYFKCLTDSNPHNNMSKCMAGGGIDLMEGKQKD